MNQFTTIRRTRQLETVFAHLSRERTALAALDARWRHHTRQGDMQTANFFSDLSAPVEQRIGQLEDEARELIAVAVGVPWKAIQGANL